MAGLMSRFTTLFKVKANTMLDKAEDPGQTLDYSYQQQLEMLQKVKRGVADVVTAKKRLQLQTAKLEESVVKLDGQARQALAGNREDLARTALERKALIQGQLQGLDTQITALEQQQQNLIDQERRLSAKVESFRTQKEVVKAQYSAAEAQVRIGEATTGLGEEMSDVGLALSARAGQDRADAGARGGGQRARRHGCHRRPDGSPGLRPRRPDRGAHRREPGRRRDGQAAGRGRQRHARPPELGQGEAPSRPSPRRSRSDRRSHPRKRPVPARRRRRGPPERARQRGGLCRGRR